MRVRRFISLWAPVWVFMALLILLPGRVDVPALESVWDKLQHASAYGVLAVLSIRAFHGGLGPLRPRPTLFALLATVAYGLLDEVGQTTSPGRDPSLWDWAADGLGALFAIPLVALVGSLRPARGPIKGEPSR